MGKKYVWPTKDEYEIQQQDLSDQEASRRGKTSAQLGDEAQGAWDDVLDADKALAEAKERGADEGELGVLSDEADMAREHYDEVSGQLAFVESEEIAGNTRFW